MRNLSFIFTFIGSIFCFLNSFLWVHIDFFLYSIEVFDLKSFLFKAIPFVVVILGFLSSYLLKVLNRNLLHCFLLILNILILLYYSYHTFSNQLPIKSIQIIITSIFYTLAIIFSIIYQFKKKDIL